MNPKPSTADEYILRGCGRCERWNTPQCSVSRHRPVVNKLIELMRSTGLKEEIKWGAPCYTYQGKNIAILGAFRNYCVLSFFKGALLNDPRGLLQKPGENTQSAKVIRCTEVHEIEANEPYLLRLVEQAIEVEKRGDKFQFEQKTIQPVEEFSDTLKSVPMLREAFQSLTPGKQKAYLLHFAEPKTAEARLRRIEKSIPKILAGEGLYDKYS